MILFNLLCYSMDWYIEATTILNPWRRQTILSSFLQVLSPLEVTICTLSDHIPFHIFETLRSLFVHHYLHIHMREKRRWQPTLQIRTRTRLFFLYCWKLQKQKELEASMCMSFHCSEIILRKQSFSLSSTPYFVIWLCHSPKELEIEEMPH